MEQCKFKREEPLYYLEMADCLTTLESFLVENTDYENWYKDDMDENLEFWRTGISKLEVGEIYSIGIAQGYTYIMRVR
tara:strand:+ start:432 stop:665 length:234 start_codon:yes stop_codon:yes gene_type:complete